LPLVPGLAQNRALTMAHRVLALAITLCPPLITGGDAAGCGWDAGVESMSATLSLGSLNQLWSADGAPLKLTLSPAFSLSMQAQVRGHVNARPGMCHWYNPFDWSCSCLIGGGFGTSVGVGASASGRFPLAAAFGASGQQLMIVAEHPTSTNVNVRLRVGLGIFGSVGLNVPVNIPHLDLYRGTVPLAVGTRGQVTIATTVKPYDLSFSADPPVAERNGIAIRGPVAVKLVN
jgi:hypothetical protein